MSKLLWLEKGRLRNIVIRDIGTCFVRPASQIICNLKPTTEDPTVHETDVHRDVQRLYEDLYDDLKDRGILDPCLAGPLLRDYPDLVEAVVDLMVHVGLLVPVYEAPVQLPALPPPPSPPSSSSAAAGLVASGPSSAEAPQVASVEQQPKKYIVPAHLPPVDASSIDAGDIFTSDPPTVCTLVFIFVKFFLIQAVLVLFLLNQ